MKIKIDLKILPLLFILYLIDSLKVYGYFIFFAFWHEFAHFIVGIICGLKPDVFEFNICGFSLNFKYDIDQYNVQIRSKKSREIKNIIIYFAGPIFNFSICVLDYFFCFSSNILYINLILGTINLIPILPLDGGRIVKAFLHIKYDLEKTYDIINKISFVFFIILLVFSSIVVLYFHNILYIISIIYLSNLYYNEHQYICQKKVFLRALKSNSTFS